MKIESKKTLKLFISVNVFRSYKTIGAVTIGRMWIVHIPIESAQKSL